MKKIEAFIRHEAFEPIRTELLDKGFPSLSISEVKGSGRQKGVVETYRGSTLTVNVRPIFGPSGTGSNIRHPDVTTGAADPPSPSLAFVLARAWRWAGQAFI